jgi:iron complex transport system substrate-binding protein
MELSSHGERKSAWRSRLVLLRTLWLGVALGALATSVSAIAAIRAFDTRSDAAGDGQTMPATRIISLVPALTEMTFAIGAGDRMVAVSSYDEFPPPVKSLPRVGALLDPDVERIIALKPDLVLLYGSQTVLMAQLVRAGIPFFEYRHGGLATVTTTIRDLGKRTGRSGEAEKVAGDIEQRLSRIRQQVAGQPKPRTLLVFGRERGSLRNIYSSGGRGFLHDMLEIAGGTNVFADILAESVQASSEMILTRAPEVIIEIRAGDGAGDRDRQEASDAWKTLGSLPAVRNGRIYVLNGQSLVVPGPRVADAIEALAKALHPH